MQKQSGIFEKIHGNNQMEKSGTNKNQNSCKTTISEGESRSFEGTEQEINFTLQKEQLLSSIFVDVGENYGTRMQTVVLVDYDNNVHFTERTRISSTLPFQWNDKTFKFTFKGENKEYS